jgi:RHS repeat-associated protein
MTANIVADSSSGVFCISLLAAIVARWARHRAGLRAGWAAGLRRPQPEPAIRHLLRMVIFAAFTFAGMLAAVIFAGAGPALADVGPDGSYSTSVRIEVPAYRGLEPDVSLIYHSDAPDGIAGPGWVLAGASQIVRTGRQGGIPAYDATDVFVLDGTELVPCSSQKPPVVSPSCTSGGTHSAKNENYTRIKREGDTWEITAKNGTRSSYTAQHVGDANLSLRWALSKRVDTHGNTVTYNYSCDGIRECYLSEIVYGNSPDTLKSRIHFYYDPRPDTPTYATGNDLEVLAKRLKTIEVRNAGALARAYSLEYRPQSGADRAQLEKVEQWGGDATVNANTGAVTPGKAGALPAHIFRTTGVTGWERGAGSDHFEGPWPDNGGPAGQQDWNATPAPTLAWQQGVRVQWFPCDFDADGRQDMLGVGREASGDLSLRVAQSDRDGTYTSRTQITSWAWGDAMSPKWRAMPGDVNGDGRCDIVLARWDPASQRVFLHAAVSRVNPVAPFAIQTAGVQTPVDEWSVQSRWFLGDTNGDHRADVMAALHHMNGSAHVAQFFVALSTGGGGFDPRPVVTPTSSNTPWPNSPQDAAHWFVGDFNGDDKAEFAHVRHVVNQFDNPSEQATVDRALSNGDGTFELIPGSRTGINWVNAVFQTDFSLYGDVGTDLVQAGDFNADGRTDLLVVGEKPPKPKEQPKIRLFTLLSQGDGGFGVVQSDTDLPLEYMNLTVSFALQQPSFPNQWISGDGDHDGATDVVILTPVSYLHGNWPTTTRATWLFSKKDGTFRIVRPPATKWPHDCPGAASGKGDRIVCPDGLTGQYFLTDVSGDGQADLAAALPATAQNGTRVGSFHVMPTWNTEGRDIQNWRLADVDGNGRKDRVYLKYTNPGVRVYTVLREESGFGALQYSDILPAFDDRAPARCRLADVGGPRGHADGSADLVCPYTLENGTGGAGVHIYTLFFTAGGWKLAPKGNGFLWPGVAFEDVWSLQTPDVNGDGNLDLVHTSAGPNGVKADTLLSLGNGSWAAASDTEFSGSGEDDGPGWRVADVNGDRFDDLVHVHFDGSATQVVRALLSQGDGHWTPTAEPLKLPSTDTADWKPGPFTPDGKTDLGHAVVESSVRQDGTRVTQLRIDVLAYKGQACISKGQGCWELTSKSVDVPADAISQIRSAAHSARVLDADNDGAADLALVETAAFKEEVKPETEPPTFVVRQGVLIWTLFNRLGAWEGHAANVATSNLDLGLPIPDVGNWQAGDDDADGRGDLVIARKDASSVRFLALRSRYDDGRLSSHANELGGMVDVSYRSSAGSHAMMPEGSVRRVVDTVRIAAGPVAPSAKPVFGDAISYIYAGARWSVTDRRFLGFAQITRTDNQLRTVTSYLQTSGCAMTPDLVRVGPRNGGPALLATTYHYDDSGSSGVPAPYRCQQKQVLTTECDATTGTCGTPTSTRFDYDTYGNVTHTWRDGKFSDGNQDGVDDEAGDNREQVATFAPNTGQYIVGLPAAIEVLDTSGSQPKRASRQQLVYDANTAFDQPPTVGDVARAQAWDDSTKKYVDTVIDHDQYGNATKVTDPTQRSTFTDYDPTYGLFPEQKCTVICQGQEWDFVLGKPTISVDPNQKKTVRHYDAFARVQRVDYPDGGCEAYDYPDWGQPGQRARVQLCLPGTNTDALGLPVEQYFDGLGRTTLVRRPSGAQKKLTYAGATDQVASATDWAKAGSAQTTETYTYDPLLRRTLTTHADGSTRQTRYEVGSETQADELGNERTVFRDGFGRVALVREFVTENNKLVAHDTRYHHDALDRLVEVIDPSKNLTTTQWDSLGRKHTTCDPDLGCWTIGYDDGDSRPDWQVDANNQRTEFRYDPAGRLTEKLYISPQSKPRSARWFYDTDPATGQPQGYSVGKITKTMMPNGATGSRFWYDAAGHVTRQTVCSQARCAETERAYDKVGRLDSVHYPDATGTLTPASEMIQYHYDPAGRLESVGGYVTSMGYNDHDQLAEIRYANDTITSLTYDPKRLWPDTERVEDLAHKTKYFSDYGYNHAGLMTSRGTDNPSAEQQDFHYDELGRLTEVTGDHAQSFHYDELGNMTYNSSVGSYTYDDPKHVHAVTSTTGASATTYTYDDNANMTSGGGRTLTWNEDNLAASVTTAAGKTTFEYDADGARVHKDGPNGSRDFLGPLVEFDANGQLVTFYYAGSRLVATRTGADVTYHYQDALGSPRLAADATGKVVARSNYAPYGTPYGSGNPAGETVGFAGKHPDNETGLIYMNARYYDPQLARFISADTIVPQTFNPQALNRYSYTYNDPLNYTDPTGHEPLGIHQRIESEDSTWDIHIDFNIGAMAIPIVETTGSLPELPPSMLTVDMAGQAAEVGQIATAQPLQAAEALQSIQSVETGTVEAFETVEAVGTGGELALTALTTLSEVSAVVIVLWSAPIAGPEHEYRALALRDAHAVIEEPLRDWVPIGEETDVLPVLEPVSRSSAYFPGSRPYIDRYEDPEIQPGHPESYELANGWEKHHVFPQALEGYFKQKGIDIHDYTISIGTEQHKAIHRGGFNDDWLLIVTSPFYPYLTKDDVLKLGNDMRKKYGIVGSYEPY